jgi:hypothetical protein
MNESLPLIFRDPSIEKTKLTKWFVLEKIDDDPHKLLIILFGMMGQKNGFLG